MKRFSIHLPHLGRREAHLLCADDKKAITGEHSKPVDPAGSGNYCPVERSGAAGENDLPHAKTF